MKLWSLDARNGNYASPLAKTSYDKRSTAAIKQPRCTARDETTSKLERTNFPGTRPVGWTKATVKKYNARDSP